MVDHHIPLYKHRELLDSQENGTLVVKDVSYFKFIQRTIGNFFLRLVLSGKIELLTNRV